jgi:hypothetical protein
MITDSDDLNINNFNFNYIEISIEITLKYNSNKYNNVEILSMLLKNKNFNWNYLLSYNSLDRIQNSARKYHKLPVVYDFIVKNYICQEDLLVIGLLLEEQFLSEDIKSDLSEVLEYLINSGKYFNILIFKYLLNNCEYVKFTENMFNMDFITLSENLRRERGTIFELYDFLVDSTERFPEIREYDIIEKYKDYLCYYGIHDLDVESDDYFGFEIDYTTFYTYEKPTILEKEKFTNQVLLNEKDKNVIKSNIQNFTECNICYSENVDRKEVCLTCFYIMCETCYSDLNICPYCRQKFSYHSIIENLQF